MSQRRPHILIFNPDQWRGDTLGHMGHPGAVTPTLDRFVESEAVSFRWAFCQNPVCTPSRCSFMTGWYPHTRGHRTMYHMLRPDEPCLLKILKDNGYFVWWGGKNDLVPGQNGYESYCNVKHRAAKPTRVPTKSTTTAIGPMFSARLTLSAMPQPTNRCVFICLLLSRIRPTRWKNRITA
jgi:arylsulfatase A-like enzyme